MTVLQIVQHCFIWISCGCDNQKQQIAAVGLNPQQKHIIPRSNKNSVNQWTVPQIASVSYYYGHRHNTFVDQTGVSLPSKFYFIDSGHLYLL